MAQAVLLTARHCCKWLRSAAASFKTAVSGWPMGRVSGHAVRWCPIAGVHAIGAVPLLGQFGGQGLGRLHAALPEEVLCALRRKASISSQRSDASVACAPRRCTTTALRVWFAQQAHFFVGGDEQRVQAKLAQRLDDARRHGLRALENASSSTMVPTPGGWRHRGTARSSARR